MSSPRCTLVRPLLCFLRASARTAHGGQRSQARTSHAFCHAYIHSPRLSGYCGAGGVRSPSGSQMFFCPSLRLWCVLIARVWTGSVLLAPFAHRLPGKGTVEPPRQCCGRGRQERASCREHGHSSGGRPEEEAHGAGGSAAPDAGGSGCCHCPEAGPRTATRRCGTYCKRDGARRAGGGRASRRAGGSCPRRR